MPLGWNEIKQRAIQFSREWAGERREEAEAKSFWDEFFNVFGVRRRTVATFEEPVRNLKGQFGYIDLFWRGKLLVEHKSFGKSLDKAESQAFQYIQDLAAEGRHDESPRYVIVSDFARIALHDLEPDEQLNLPLFAGRPIAMSVTLPSSPGTNSIVSTRKTPPISAPPRPWAVSTTPSPPAATPGTRSNGCWCASSFACSPRTPAFSSRTLLPVISTPESARTGPILACTSA